MPRRSPISIACAGGSNSSSALSRVRALPWKTARSSMPSGCSILPQSRSPLPFALFSWSTPGTAAPVQPAMSSTMILLSHSNGSRANSKAPLPSKKILIPPARWPSSHGSQRAWEVGTAIMENPDQRPCALAGPNSPPPWQAMPSLLMGKIRESRSPAGERERATTSGSACVLLRGRRVRRCRRGGGVCGGRRVRRRRRLVLVTGADEAAEHAPDELAEVVHQGEEGGHEQERQEGG